MATVFRLVLACARSLMNCTRVTVLVLGDLGRSPRMQYHALALAQRGVEVDIVAHCGHDPNVAVLQHPLIALHLIAAPALRARVNDGGAGYLALAAADAIALAARGLHALLFRARPPDVVLVQSPPAFPALAL